MDKQEYEQFLIRSIADAEPHNITKEFIDTQTQSREERLDYELCELLTTCAVFESDPIKLQAAIRRHLVGIVNRMVEESNLPDYRDEKYDRYAEYEEWLYQERRDRELER